MKAKIRQRNSFSPVTPAGTHHREKKAWGEEIWIVNREYCGKKLLLKKDRRCSMHLHKEKDEVFFVESGNVLLELGGKRHTLHPGDSIHIPAGAEHRFTGIEESVIFEFSTTHREQDSYRSEYSGHVDPERFDQERQLIDHFSRARILVIGDVMLDTYTAGGVERISPEAPIPVVRFHRSVLSAGGAANVALNIMSLGGSASLIGVRGDDLPGEQLATLLSDAGVRSFIVTDEKRCTTVKQRIIADRGQQMVRIDYENDAAISRTTEAILMKKIRSELPRCSAVLLSDYGKGVLTPPFLQAVIAQANKAHRPVILDPKPQDRHYLDAVKGVTLLSPNAKEAMILHGGKAPIENMGRDIARRIGADVLLTLGDRGMLLIQKNGRIAQPFPTLAKEVADVSGAGDTVAAVIALVLALEGTLPIAVDLANRAASVVVGKVGTATLSSQELLATL